MEAVLFYTLLRATIWKESSHKFSHIKWLLKIRSDHPSGPMISDYSNHLLIFTNPPLSAIFDLVILSFCVAWLNSLQTIPSCYHGPTVIVTNVSPGVNLNRRENLPLAHCFLTGLNLTVSTLARRSRFRNGSIEIYTEWNKDPKVKN